MSLAKRRSIPRSRRREVENADFVFVDHDDLVFSADGMSFEKLRLETRKSLAIGCQLVAPRVLIQVVNPRSKIVLTPFTSKDHHFGARQGDHCSLNPVGCEG